MLGRSRSLRKVNGLTWCGRTGDTFAHEGEDIWERTSCLLPSLVSDETEVVAAFSGLRPSREGGARVERGTVDNNRSVIHCYGAGGTGFQAGYGMANEAVELAGAALTKLSLEPRARL